MKQPESATIAENNRSKPRHGLREWLELLSSMRFAISLLTLIAIASTIGTILKQNEPRPNYINQFGPFWFEIFDRLSFYNVYSAWWFLLILAFLVASTSLCLIRNSPKMLADMRSWKDKIQENGLRSFHHRAEGVVSGSLHQVAQEKANVLLAQGYRIKALEREHGVLLTAKRGAANKLGYIFAHAAIVIICLGALLDGDLFIRAQLWLGHKSPLKGNAVIAEVPATHRLSPANPSFRANVMIAEGRTVNTAILNYQDGMLIQDLPFSIKLNKFTIEHYSTGMPKLFASEVEIIDPDRKEPIKAVVKVNEPLIHKGMAIYQSSFEDGGSKLTLRAYPMQGGEAYQFEFNSEVGRGLVLGRAEGKWQPFTEEAMVNEAYGLEFSGFRPMNVENLADDAKANDARAVAQAKQGQSTIHLLGDSLESRLGSGAKVKTEKVLRNVGPSIQYKLRDAAGQAREFNNYMLPVAMNDQLVFLLGVRDSPGQPFRYLSIPADNEASLKQWMLLRAALANPTLRARAAAAFSANAQKTERPEVVAQLQLSAQRTLDIFAGASSKAAELNGGLAALSAFIEQTVPQEEQSRAADVFLKILTSSLWQLWQEARADAHLPPAELSDDNARFMQAALTSLSDSFFYQAPVVLQLTDFTEVKASVFQVTRSPGKKIVYLGCVLLVLGVFSMFYVRERRVWIWLKPYQGQVSVLMAMSSQRKTLDFEKEFEALKAALIPHA